MKFRFFSVPVRKSSDAEEELNTFVASHRVVSIERRFVDAGLDSFWAVSVEVTEGLAALGKLHGAPGRAERKVDYKEVLTPSDFERFLKLRELRKVIAEREAVPVYNIFTNQQLADMIQGKVTTIEGLEAIDGIGAARVGKFGAVFLELLRGMGIEESSQ
jgi:superfamily II DNA helicase RecQ